MLKSYIKLLAKGLDLTEGQAYQAALILFQSTNQAQIASFLTLLSMKGEVSTELLGFYRAIKDMSIASSFSHPVLSKEIKPTIKFDYPVIDIVGTGGDNSGTVNISTASALLVAACGVPVVKHGNRAVSSKCGAADVLEQLGYDINLNASELMEQVAKTKFGFCLAPLYNPSLAKVREVRSSIGIPSIFNLLGPLLNPVGINPILLGVYSPDKIKVVAETLHALGCMRALVFHAYGLDELSCIGPIEATLVTVENGLNQITIDPEKLGLKLCSHADLSGHDALYNALLIKRALSGEDTPINDTLILNAAVGLWIYGATKSIEGGVKIVKDRLYSRAPILKPNKLLDILARKYQLPQKKKSLKTALSSKTPGAVIGEIKRASPALGQITTIDNPAQRALMYVDAGVNAISVLTDEGFQGSLDDLKKVSEALTDTNVPILCKDFFFSPMQIARAAENGADAILIMVSVLHNKTAEMVKTAHSFGLETLVEVHHESELAIALASGGDVIGINQRDLRDFSMHPELFEQLVSKIPLEQVVVAESGTKSYADAKRAYSLGYDAVLVGEALSRLDNPTDFFKD
jgi:anthranilate phosphoribosyltransferase